MAVFAKPSFAPSTALIYVTVGALLDAWTTVYYLAFGIDTSSDSSRFWLGGFFLTGLILMIIGFTLGPLGRAARQAEPPLVVTPDAPIVVPPTSPPAAVNPLPRAAIRS